MKYAEYVVKIQLTKIASEEIKFTNMVRALKNIFTAQLVHKWRQTVMIAKLMIAQFVVYVTLKIFVIVRVMMTLNAQKVNMRQ